MSKILSVVIALIAFSKLGTAQDGYTLTIQLKNATPGMLSLSVYRGSPSFSFTIDSAHISKPEQLVKFATSKKILGGIYKLEFNRDKQNSRNVVLDNGKKIHGTISSNQLATLTCSDSLNTLFLQLQQPGLVISERGAFLKKLVTAYPSSVAALYAKFELKKAEAAAYISTLERLKIIDNYFVGINLDDKKIPLLPNIYSYLFEYIKLTPVNNESYKKNVDRMLKGMNCNSRNYAFYLDWVFKNIKYYEKANLNETFKYVYDRYLNNETCLKLHKDFHSKISLEVASLSDLKPGVRMPDMIMQDSLGKPYKLQELYGKSQYTLLVLYDPSCDHCKVLMPEIATYFATKNYPESLVQLVAFRNTATKGEWQKFIQSSRLQKWLNTEPYKNDNSYLNTLKAYTNPMFFLIDRQGNIVLRKYDEGTYTKLFTHP